MGKKLTKEEFIKKAKEIHGNKYDYSKVDYKNNKTEILIICPEHGEFYQIPMSHLDGCGCPNCSGNKKLTTEEFIKRAKEIHGNKYDYSKVDYEKSLDKVCIICPEHGEFWQTPSSHLRGRGCPNCSGNKKLTTEEFIKRAKEIHGNKYDYSKVDYVSGETEIPIICPIHGEFYQKPYNHLNGMGCPKCGGHAKSSTKEFIEKAKEIHGDRYDYSKVDYKDIKTKVCIICPEHGEFYQTPKDHLRGHGCPSCSGNKKLTTEEFIEKARKVHGNKYDYSKVNCKGNRTNVCIICPEHGEFYQTPYKHLMGQGCPKCSGHAKSSTKEFIKKAKEIHGDRYDYSKVDYERSQSNVCIICPEHGEFWQTPNKHLMGRGCPKCSCRAKLSTKEFIEKAKEIHGDRYDYSKVDYKDIKTKVCIICPEHGEFYQTPYKHLMGQGCPNCYHLTRDFKINLLKSGDLVNLSQHQLFELTLCGKLPKEFKSLQFTRPGSLGRQKAIKSLLEYYSNDEDLDKISQETITLDNEEERLIFTGQLGEDQEELDLEDNSIDYLQKRVLKSTHSLDNLSVRYKDQSSEFIVIAEIRKIWNTVLRADDENRLEEALEIIKKEEGGEFFNYIREEFFKEYDIVSNIESGDDYRFPEKPSLMQKLIVYYLTQYKSFGNWCGTGAGKTNAFLMATRALNARVTVAIVPNDVINTLCKAIKEIYPDSNIIIPESSKELKTYDRSKFNYIIYNYEKFHGNNGAVNTIKRLLETNVIDFVCLDEVQNVKIRYAKSASDRSQFIRNFVEQGRALNPDMRVHVMSATPCINNLTEVRSIIELMMGVEYKEIGSINSFINIHNAYKALVLNGIRYVPKYPIDIKERIIEVDCSGDLDLISEIKNLEKGNTNGFDYLIAKRKLETIKAELVPGSIVYSNWVEGMAEMLTENIRDWGFKVESYNGKSGNKEGRKDILDRFLSGQTDILVCSKPISTGVDGLQHRCNKMIIVSLPWTDADYMQLKGRIYRQGSRFERVEFVIPQVIIRMPSGVIWSWDKIRKNAIETKKSLGSAIVDGYIQGSYTINKEELLFKAMKVFRDGFIDQEVERKVIITDVIYDDSRKKLRESLVTNTHRLASISNSRTTHKKYLENREEFIKYHRERDILMESWTEDPVTRVAKIINQWSSEYSRVLDMGCGYNKLKGLVDSSRTVIGVDHINITDDPTVIEADMSDLSEFIKKESMDTAVICLSLWGKNYEDYFSEANRVLRDNGRLVIVEPTLKFRKEARFEGIDNFTKKVERKGFKLMGEVELWNNFAYLVFSK